MSIKSYSFLSLYVTNQKIMRVLIATGLFPPDIGGPATYSAMLLEELPKKGISVTIAAFGRVRHLPKVIRHFVYFFHLLIAGRSADMIYAQDPVSVGLPALLASRILRKPLVLRVPGDYAWEQGMQRFGVSGTLDEFSKSGSKSWRVQVLRKIESFVARHARKIIVPSEYLRSIVKEWGIHAAKIKVVYNAHAAPKSIEGKSVLRERLSLSGTILVSIGRLVPWKGFATLIELVPALERFYPDVHLFIIGDGPERSLLDKKIRAAHLEGKVSLLGRLPQAVALNYVRAADLFVLNTSYEGFSHQLVEVMSMETPIVTTEVGGNPELITHRENGLLVPYDDRIALLEAIKEVLKDEKLAKRLSKHAFDSLKAFNQDELVDKLVKELQSL